VSALQRREIRKGTDIFRRVARIRRELSAVDRREPEYPLAIRFFIWKVATIPRMVQSSLLCAMGTRATPPYRGVVTPGWTLDEKVSECRIARQRRRSGRYRNRLGGEIVRSGPRPSTSAKMWFGSEALMQRVGDNYKKIRNTFRYILTISTL